MKKCIIGILATSNYMVTDDSFMDTYRFGNNYIKKIVENGAVPLLIPYVNEQVIEESLEMCDGLLLSEYIAIDCMPIHIPSIGLFLL